MGAKPVILNGREAKIMQKFNPDSYKTRQRIENPLSRLKQFRRIATRAVLTLI